MTLITFNCEFKKIRLIATYYYVNEDNLKLSKEFEEFEVEMKYAVPGTLGKLYLKYHCDLD